MSSAALKPKKNPDDVKTIFCRERARGEEGDTDNSIRRQDCEEKTIIASHINVQKPTSKGDVKDHPLAERMVLTEKKSVAGNPSHLEASAYFTATLTLKVGQTTANSLHT